ncbi:MAG: M1 family metallopeptidase, partial [bacterium]|nr:M1 family metallopeptidase [bacterium]
VSDVIGDGNEEWFPTLNTPHELARHRLTFRVHSEKEYRFLGSGLVVQTGNEAPGTTKTTAPFSGPTTGLAGGTVQEWSLDTEREIASYTVMFMAMPADLVDYEEATVEGVDLRIMAYKDISYDSGIGAVKYALINWLAELKRELGPFPMERGLSIFVTGVDGGGMEYFGATQTSVEALMHEVLHMYFGCSTVNKTYRDTWLDEAIVEWYDISKVPDVVPIDDTYRSDIVSGRTPTSIGFDGRAYKEGTGIMLAVSTELGGREQMMGFLRYLHENYSYAPFNTFDFLQYLRDYSGIDMEDKFLNWLYDGRRDYSPASVTSGSLSTNSPPLSHQRKKPNLKPSLKLLKKTGYK